MTTEELKAEWNYRYEERLGILCEDLRPTPDQRRIAAQEADQTVRELTTQGK